MVIYFWVASKTRFSKAPHEPFIRTSGALSLIEKTFLSLNKKQTVLIGWFLEMGFTVRLFNRSSGKN